MKMMSALAALALALSIASAQAQSLSGPPTPVVPCTSPPAPDSLMGTTGSAAPCIPAADASRPTAVQAATVQTDSQGAWAVTWAKPFTSAFPMVLPIPVNTGNLPILCNVVSRAADGATGRCWQSTATTLPAAVTSILGLVVSPFGNPASGASVMVIARAPTQ